MIFPSIMILIGVKGIELLNIVAINPPNGTETDKTESIKLGFNVE